MPKLADFDAPTQERATGAFQQFLASYKLSASLFSADDLGAAVEAATRGHGSADAGFKERLFDGLYRALHRHMGELAARAQRVPSGLDAAAYDKLQRTLVSRFGALPAGSGAAGTVEEGKVRAPGSASIGEVLAGRAGPPNPIDVSVAAALRSGESGSSAPTRPDRAAGSAPARPDEVLYVYRITETATGRVVELGVPGQEAARGGEPVHRRAPRRGPGEQPEAPAFPGGSRSLRGHGRGALAGERACDAGGPGRRGLGEPGPGAHRVSALASAR
jgi:hypothetical protein